MENSILPLASEINSLLKETPTYNNYSSLKEKIESDKKLVDVYNRLLETGEKISLNENIETDGDIEIPLILKQYITVQKELNQMVNQIIAEMQRILG
jgi:hypothetical protein